MLWAVFICMFFLGSNIDITYKHCTVWTWWANKLDMYNYLHYHPVIRNKMEENSHTGWIPIVKTTRWVEPRIPTDKSHYTLSHKRQKIFICCIWIYQVNMSFLFFFLQIVVLMAIFAICAASPQGLGDFLNLFNPLYYLSLLTGQAPKPSNSTNTTSGWTTSYGKLACNKRAVIHIILLLKKIYKISLIFSCYYMQLLLKTSKTNHVLNITKLMP
jgi:hypothetical protein